MTTGRTVMAVIAAGLGFVAGFYAGVFALLSVVGFGDLAGWQFPVATVPTGSLVAAAGASLPARHTGRAFRRAFVGAVVAAAVATAIVLRVDGDFGLAIGLGGSLALAATVAGAWSAGDE